MVDGNKVNTISFVINKYANEDEMWKDISTVARILLHNDEIITLEQEDEWVYILKHECADEEIADALPFWQSVDDYENGKELLEMAKNGDLLMKDDLVDELWDVIDRIGVASKDDLKEAIEDVAKRVRNSYGQ